MENTKKIEHEEHKIEQVLRNPILVKKLLLLAYATQHAMQANKRRRGYKGLKVWENNLMTLTEEVLKNIV